MGLRVLCHWPAWVQIGSQLAPKVWVLCGTHSFIKGISFLTRIGSNGFASPSPKSHGKKANFIKMILFFCVLEIRTPRFELFSCVCSRRAAFRRFEYACCAFWETCLVCFLRCEVCVLNLRSRPRVLRCVLSRC